MSEPTEYDVLNQLTQLIKTTQAQVEQTKQMFEQVITIDQIPLETRWQFWKASPDYLKNQYPYIPDISSVEKVLKKTQDEYDFSRLEHVTANDLESLLEDMNLLKLLEQVKSDMLKDNLGSFTYDW